MLNLVFYYRLKTKCQLWPVMLGDKPHHTCMQYTVVVCSFIIICLFVFTVEMSTLTREKGTTKINILRAAEVEELIKEHEQVKAEEAKQAAAKK